VNTWARFGLSAAFVTLAVETVFGVFLFSTADPVAAVLGMVGITVFLAGGILGGAVFLRERGPAEIPSARTFLFPATVGLVIAAVLIFLETR